MNFRPLTLMVLCIAAFTATGDLIAQQQKEVAGETKKQKLDPADSKQESAEQKQESTDQKQSSEPKTNDVKECVLLDVEMTDISGNKVNLKKYEGKVILIVNVASKCGFTGQYKPLQELHKRYKEHGLEVIAFPCNQFGKQEPADEPTIDAFCKKKYGIEFDLFSKVDVKGKKQAELFKRLTECNLAPAGKGDIYWNFEKFLIGKDGKPIARFRSNVSPDDEKIVSKLKAALGIKEEKKDESKKEKTSKKKSEAAKETSSQQKAAPEEKAAPEQKEDKKS